MKLSATSIQTYDAKEFSGCPRRWFFKYVDRIPEPPSEYLVLGNAVHSRLEGYLKSVDPLPAEPVVERLFQALLPEADRVLEEGVSDVEKSFTIPLFDDVLLTGKIDVVRPKGPLDWKTSSDLKRVPTPFKLARTTQMQIYAWAFERLYNKKAQFVSHVYVQTKGPALTQRVDAPIHENVLTEGISGIINISKDIVAASKLPNASDLKPERDKCRAGTKLECPYLNICKPDKETVMSAIDRLKNRLNGAPPAAASAASAVVDATPTAPEVQRVVPADAPPSMPPPAPAAPRPEPVSSAPAPAPLPETAPTKRGPGRPRKVTVVDVPPEAPAPTSAPTSAPAPTAAPAPATTTFKPRQVTVSMSGKLNMGHYQSLDIQVGQVADYEGDPNEAFVQLMALVKRQLDSALETVAGRTVTAEVPPSVLVKK